jgi:amidase
MTGEEFLSLDAVAAAELVHRGEVSPVELVEAAIERIDALSHLNAVVERCFDQAREAAVHVDRTRPLAGVPFLAKDMNIEVRGLHLTASCRFLAALPPAVADAPLAARWRDAGLCILGRTNTPEFAGDFVTEPTWRGATANPWDLTRSPGGSSGGAAAAVAAGLVPVAHGTDSGGSIRVPSAACGLVGLKPSRGWVPVGPRHDELAGGLDCEHVVARSVRDSALMLDVTCGPDAGSRYAVPSPRESFAASALQRPGRLTVGIALDSPGGVLPSDEIAAATLEVGRYLERAGHRLVKFEYPPSAAQVGAAAAVLWMAATAEELDYYRRLIGRSPEPHELEALTVACVRLAERSSALDYVRARRTLSVVSAQMAVAFRGIDVLLLPTTSSTAILTGTIDGRTEAFDLDRWNEDSYRYAPFTELFNATGQPAISLPLAQSRDGLPIGVQFAARLGQDALLLKLAGWLELEMPWHGRLRQLQSRLGAL